LTAALTGFLFGFHTVVISGANLPIKELWNTTPWNHGTFIMSMVLWGTGIGSHAMDQGVLIWIFISGMFPNRLGLLVNPGV